MKLRHSTQHTPTVPPPRSSSSSSTSYQRQTTVGRNNLPAGSGDMLMPISLSATVRVRRKSLPNFPGICEKLRAVFGVQLQEVQIGDGQQQQYQQQFATFQVLQDENAGCQAAVGGDVVTGNSDLISQVQQFIDSLCTNEAEDSSYDSDCDGDELSHEQVSRTTSDTLGQEFAEYVSVGGGGGSHHHPPHGTDGSPTATTISPATTTACTALPEHSPGYQQRVEFALKLGYTERLVQAALQRLGPSPAQNELLAELIKLGSQPGAKGANEFTVHDCHGHHGMVSDGGGGGGALLGADLPGSMGSAASGLSSASSPTTMAAAAAMGSEESLRPIVIDGSNVAMSHGNKEAFSCRGIRLCVDWFKNRGHKDITVFVPKWRKESARPDNPVKDGELLSELEKERMLVFTPSRLVNGKRMVCYDDRYILKLAADNDGVVVSNDNYRDLVQESSEFKKVVEERVLMYSFVNDRFMPPDDPLGRSGPTLDNFLRIQPRKGDPPPPCPYGKKCTYGNKCKFYHPERGSLPHKSVTERLSEYAARHLQARSGLDPSAGGAGRCAVQGKSLSVPLSNSSNETSPINDKRKALCRTRSNVPSDSSNLPSYGGISMGPPTLPSDLVLPHPVQHSGGRQQQQQQPPPQQQQQLPFLAPPVASNRPIPWEHQHPHGSAMVDVQQIFPKSHSIENIAKEPPPPPYGAGGGHHGGLHHAGCYGGAQGLWARPHQPSSQPPSQSSPPSLDQADPNGGLVDGVNLHRKLHRQLTLNPAGCDPRIYQMQRLQQQSAQQQQQAGAQQQQQSPGSQQLSPHRPLAPSLSGGSRPSPPTQWEMHQHVTRNASAPDSVRPWGHNGPPPASSSEPHINLGWSSSSAPGGPAVVVSQQQQQQHHHQQQQQDRRRLHYHLASIFPEEQVQTVMQMYPDETNPQTICAAILAMFQKM